MKYKGTTGITASLNNTTGSLVLTQAQGQNIQLSGYSTAGGAALASAAARHLLVAGDDLVDPGFRAASSRQPNPDRCRPLPPAPSTMVGHGRHPQPRASPWASLQAGSGGNAANFNITLSNKALGPVTATSSTESAASLAASVNSLYSADGVAASASNTYSLGKMATGASVSFTLASSSGKDALVGSAEPVTGTSAATLMASINSYTNKTGITASSASGTLKLTQADGQNIQISGYSASATGVTMAGASAATGGSIVAVQGTLQLSAASSISTTSTTTMVSTTSAPEAGLTAAELAAGTGGAAQKFGITVGGVALGSVTPANSLQSAASLASQVNSMDGAKGVTASASNVVNLGQLAPPGRRT